MRPNRLIARSYALRGAYLWACCRILLSVLFLFSGTNPLDLHPAAVVGIILLSVFAGFVEIHRRSERALLGNLAIAPQTLGILFAVPAVAGELLLQVVRAAAW